MRCNVFGWLFNFRLFRWTPHSKRLNAKSVQRIWNIIHILAANLDNNQIDPTIKHTMGKSLHFSKLVAFKQSICRDISWKIGLIIPI